MNRRDVPVQELYDAVTWLLSECPSGRLDEGATPGYHAALRCVTALRTELRNDDVVEHNDAWWHRGRKFERLAEAQVGASDNSTNDHCEHKEAAVQTDMRRDQP